MRCIAPPVTVFAVSYSSFVGSVAGNSKKEFLGTYNHGQNS